MTLLEWAHFAGFGFGCVGCLLACWRARLITHRETRLGLYGLFLTSSLWAGAYLVTFVTRSLALATAAYQVGLIAGLATVGAWLYFCSAYTGNDYHRQPAYRRAGLAAFLGISAVKLTNQVHGLYFSIEMVETPFPHADVALLDFHWLVTVFAYALTAVGFYMLLELFVESRVSTRGLLFLVGLTALPVLVDVLGVLGLSAVVATNYEPLGVAAFALGTLYITEDTFERVRWTGHRQVLDELDEAILLLDETGQIYQHNTAAETLFPSVDTADSIEGLVPETERIGNEEMASDWVDEAELMAFERDETTSYYLLRETELTVGPHLVGRAVVLTDVTQVERQRRELERRSDQLEGFAAAVAHELRNSLTIIEGNLTVVSESIDADEIRAGTEVLERISAATTRMSNAVEDLTTIGQLSQPVTDPKPYSFQTVVTEALGAADTASLTLSVEGEGEVRVERMRLTELLRNAVRLATETDATKLALCLRDGGFVVRMDGESLGDSDTEALFEYGTPIPHANAGMLGPNIRSLARTHGWDVSARTPEDGGIVITVSGVVTG